MNPTQYMGDSERTEKKFPEGMTLTGDNLVILSNLTTDIVAISEGLDHMKRHLVYGASNQISIQQSEFARKSRDLSSQQAEMLHAGMGIVTEAVEFFEMLMAHILNGEELDLVNLNEEIGDSLWYQALALRLLDGSFEGTMQTNIAKLQARFPDKFTSEAALNRDLDTEREILEVGIREGDPSTFAPQNSTTTAVNA